jgi:transcriptional regulator with XRE-family HTH domain
MPAAANIKKIRLDRNYTQKFMAKSLAMTHANYGKIENGRIKITSARIEQIAAILKVPPNEITDQS